MDLHKKVILVGIILTAIFLRGWGLLKVPPSLNWDEVSHGYTGYSLLLTGRDQWGTRLPLFNFRAYGDYPTTLNVYATVLPIALLGPSDFAIRLPHVLIGVLSVLAIFVAGAYWHKNINTGLWAAGIMAISPWAWFLSRQVLQSNWTVLLICLALAYWAKRDKLGFSLMLFISLFSYHNARIFIPLLAFIQLRWLKLTGVLLILLSIGILLSPTTRVRNGVVGIVDVGAVAKIESQRNSSRLPDIVAKMVYNRPVYFLVTASRNYLDYLKPGYIFGSGGTQYQFSLPKFALVPPVLLLPFILGFGTALVSAPPLIIGLFLSILPAAITQDRFAVVRSTTMIPFVMLITGFGCNLIWKKLSGTTRILVIGMLVVGVTLYSVSYIKNYFSIYPQQFASSWQYGYREMVSLIRQNYDHYDQVIVTKRYGEPHEYLLWYWTWDPKVLQTQNIEWDYHDNWYWVDGFDKFKFVNDWQMRDYTAALDKSKRYLIISSPENPVGNAVLGQVAFPDNRIAFWVKEL
jgi:hypothetical protein